MKLADIKPQVSKFYLKHPVTDKNFTTDAGNDVYWNVVGHDSVQYAEAQQDFLKKLEKLGSKASKLKAKDYRAQAVTQLASLVVGWDSEFDDFHSGEFSQEKVEEVLTDTDYGWAFKQLDRFVGERANFFAR